MSGLYISGSFILDNDPYEQERFDILEDQQETILDEIEKWRENTIFKCDNDYKGKKVVYDRWYCKWGNRDASAKYISIDEAREYASHVK